MAQGKFIEFTLEGDSIVYRLLFDANEIAEVEKETGLNLLYCIKNLDSMSMLQFRALLWALLRPGHKSAGVTLKEAGELIGRSEEGRRVITEAMRKALGEKALDEVLLEGLRRIAQQNPDALAEMLAAAGATFEAVPKES